MKAARRALLLAALAAPVALRAQGTEIIELRHRTAEDLLPLLRPLLEPGGALSGQGGQLLVRATPAGVQQLRALLATLDRPPRMLEITVRHDLADTQQQRSVSADGSVVVSSRGSGAQVGIEASNARTESTRRIGQRVRVIEGGRVQIGIGVAIPFTFNHWTVGAQGLTEVRATTVYEAVTGLAVRPTLAGEVVTLDLTPADLSLAPAGVDRLQLMTRVRGRLGEWIAVGGADLAPQARRDGAASSQRGAWLRVDDVTDR